MGSFESFKQQLQDTLGHLYDPAFSPAKIVWMATGVAPSQGVEAVQAALIRAIEALRPAPEVPPKARARRIYDLLAFRYVQQLTQEEVADHLGFTPRHVRREQREAVDVLAHRLWEKHSKTLTGTEATSDTNLPAPDAVYLNASPQSERLPSSAWRSQVRQELASLQKTDPDSVANVEEAIDGVVALERALAAKHGICLQVGHVPQRTYVAIHPSALRQILVTAIGKLVQCMSSGQIMLSTECKSNSVRITITGCPVKEDKSLSSLFENLCLTSLSWISCCPI